MKVKMSIEQEISRLQDLMPASARISCRIIGKPQQTAIITSIISPPWRSKNRPISINFDLWRKLSSPQRDLLFLRTVALSLGVKWLKFDVYTGVAISALGGLSWEIFYQDIVGIIVAGSLVSFGVNQIWKQNRSLEKEIQADENGIKVATRRGYSTLEATQFLIDAIEKSPLIESRRGLTVTELRRIKNLRQNLTTYTP